MKFSDCLAKVGGAKSLSKNDLLSLCIWSMHEKGSDYVSVANLRSCFDEAHLPDLSGYGGHLTSLRSQGRVIKGKAGYKLSHDERAKWSKKFTKRSSTVEVDGHLKRLLGVCANDHQRTFLEEVFLCVSVGAFRSACVMAWNFAYDALCEYVIAKRLADFNNEIQSSFRKSPPAAIAVRTDFEEWKEFDVIRVAYKAKLITKNQKTICDQRLKRRNMLAHPSSISVTQLQAEDMIIDLMDNIVGKL